MDLNALLRRAVDLGASDVHLKLGRAPFVRCDGSIEPLDAPLLTESDLDSALRTITALAPQRYEQFQEAGDLDLAYAPEGLPRFRVNIFRQRGAISMALRVIPATVLSFDELGLPPGVEALAEEQRGLVLVTGATGSGKTTTLAAMLDRINRTRRSHIVTIEDPIEILHTDHLSIVNQREVGLDTASFAQALRRALRQDPDTILIGELRDAETAQTALQAAESGHLVLSTMHTIDAAETVGRMIEFFPEAKQQQIRSIMAGVLRGVVSQRLLPRAGGGRVAAVEVMVTNARIADLIREARADEITDAIGDGEFFKMQTLEQALIDLVARGDVETEIGAGAAPNRHDFLVALDRELKRRAVAVEEPEPEAGPGAAGRGSGARLAARGTAVTFALAAFAFAPGLAVGSFLNVVAARLPLGRSVATPRSACMHCGTEIRARDNVPVVSYLLLRGRCHSCRAPIGLRYPAVELAHGAPRRGVRDRLRPDSARPRRRALLRRACLDLLRPTSSTGSSRTGSSCRQRSRCSLCSSRGIPRSSGRRRASAPRSSSSSSRSPIRAGWGWAT